MRPFVCASTGPRAEEVPSKNQSGRRSGPFRFCRGLVKVRHIHCSPHHIVSQSTTLQERSEQGCKLAKHETNSPLDNHSRGHTYVVEAVSLFS